MNEYNFLQPFNDLNFKICNGTKCITLEEKMESCKVHEYGDWLLRQKYMSYEKCKKVDGKIIADDGQ